MESTRDKIINGGKETIFLLEHQDVYTIGNSVQEYPEEIEGISVIKTNRGGKITYHGIGQRVLYPILNIQKHFGGDIRKYVSFLENVVILSLSKLGISAFKSQIGNGVWALKENQVSKIAALGIHIKKYVAIHGFALNVCPDLSHFDVINPCGIENCKTTSIKDLGVISSYKEIDQIIYESFFDLI